MPDSILDDNCLDACLDALSGAGPWYVGFSGGPDSAVLLHLLAAWRRRRPGAPPLSAVHVDHGLQPSSAEWPAHCARVCDAVGVPLLQRTAIVSRGGEAGAREARYRVFADVLAGGGVLFLAHHQDDQVETFFLRLMRGAGVEGLAAMPERRALGRGLLVRPLLGQSRAALEDYARCHGLDFVEDPSNLDTGIDRNFLRAEVLPLIASRWPAYRSTVSRAAEHMATAVDLLRQTLDLPPTLYSSAGDPGLALAALTESTAAIAARRLRDWLRLASCQAPDRASLEEFLRQLRQASADAAPRLDTGSYSLQRYAGAVYLLPDFPCDAPVRPVPLAAGESVTVPGVGQVSLVAAPEGFYLGPGDAPHLRWRRGGERCRLPGRRGSISLKNYLRERELPPWWRDRVPLLYVGDELLAVADLAVCESSRRRAGNVGEPLWRVAWERSTASASLPSEN
ncbi:MAG: tRNA lysidine(34) synthetase TilS [Halioglobus sp.]|nr:tRNA lysidine(34) synthetase TilS [Halioglobus sp.]